MRCRVEMSNPPQTSCPDEIPEVDVMEIIDLVVAEQTKTKNKALVELRVGMTNEHREQQPTMRGEPANTRIPSTSGRRHGTPLALNLTNGYAGMKDCGEE